MAGTDILSNFQKIMQGISEAGDSDLFAGSLKSLQQLDKTLQNQQKLIEEASKKGRWGEIAKLVKIADEAGARQTELTEQIVEAQEKLKKLQVEQDQKGIQAQLKHIESLNKQMVNLSERTAKQQTSTIKITKNLEKNVRNYKRILEDREEKYAELGKMGAMFEEKLGNRLEGVVDTFTGGLSDIDSLGKSINSTFSTFGKFAGNIAGELKAKGEAAGDDKMVGMADLLGKVGKFAKTMAVVGGSVMALVALFKFVEGTIIEANKKLVEGTGLIDLMAAGGENLNESLEKVRTTFKDSSFANAMGIPLDDTLELVGKFEQLNMGIKQFGGGVEAMEKMKDAMKSAKGMSLALGISMDEASQYMAKFAFDLGVSVKDGAIMGRIADEFANIRDMALQSSYQTSNFFKKVTELTGQLENMNYRTEEAGSLMIRFAKVLGKSGLDAALQQLFTGFRGEGYLEQLKTNMLTKSEELQAATKVEAIRFGQTFLKFFGDPKEKGGVGGQVEKLLGAIGGDSLKQVKEAENKGKKLMEIVGSLDENKRQAVMAKLLKDKSVSDEMRAELYKFMRLARGARKGATQAEKQAAQEEMGATGNLRSKAALIASVIGDKNINNLSVIQKAALEQFKVSKDQIELFAQLQTGYKGTFKEIKDLQSGKKKFSDVQVKDKETGEMRAAKSVEEAILAMDAGVKLNEKGQLVMKDTGEVVKSFAAFLQAQGESLDEKFKEAGPKTQEQYLDEGIKATTSVFDVLNNTISGILTDISEGIYGLFQFFSGESGDEKEAKANVVRMLKEELAGMSEERKAEESEIRKEEKRLDALSFKKGLSKEEVEKAAKDRAALNKRKEELKEAKAKEDRTREQLRTVQNTTYSGIIDDYEEDDILKESAEDVYNRRKATGRETGKLGEARKRQSEDLKGLEKIIGGATYSHLNAYLQQGGMDDKVLKRMAEKGLKYTTEGEQDSDHFVGRISRGDKVVSTVGETFMGTDTGTARYNSTEESELANQTLGELKKLREPRKKAERDREEKERVKASEKESVEIGKKAFLEAKKEEKQKELEAIAKALNLKGSATSKQIATAYTGTDDQKKKLKALSLGGNTLSQNLLYGPQKVNDILITDKGNYALDREDQYLPLMREGYAFAKPGGVMDKAGGLGGGGNNLVFNIYDARNADLVTNQVMGRIRQVNAMTGGGGR